MNSLNLIYLASNLFIQEPTLIWNGRIEQEDISKISSILEQKGQGVVVASVGDSYEYQILDYMQDDPLWTGKIRTSPSLTLEECHGALSRLGEIRFSEIRGTVSEFANRDAFKQWVIEEIAPLNFIDSSEYEQFANDYINYAYKYRAIRFEGEMVLLLCKQLIVTVDGRCATVNRADPP